MSSLIAVTHVLVIISYFGASGGGGKIVFFHEFASKETCENAKTLIMATQERQEPNFKVECFPK